MEGEYNTMDLEDTIALGSPVSESRLLNLDINTEVLNVCESAQHSGDQMEDNYCHKEIILDSDDEGGDRNEAVDSCVPRIGRLSGRSEIGLRKRQKVRTGCFRRLDKKVRKHVFLHIDSARSDRCDEEGSNSGRTCLYSDTRFREHLGVMDCVQSTSSPDQKPIPTNAKEILADPDYPNTVTKCLVEDSLDKKKLSSHDSNFTNTGKEANYDCERAQLSNDESPEAAESHNKALDFVDHYLSGSDFGPYKNIETGKANRITSPPSLRSKGTRCLARRVSLAHNASNLMTFSWTGKHTEDPISGIEESDNVNLQNEISSLHSKEKLPGNTFSTNGVGTNSLNSDDFDKIGSNSGNFTAYDSTELVKQLDAGLPLQNVEEGENLRLSPEALDIGMDTQTAAEAMEELIHAAPFMLDPCLIHQDLDNTLLSSFYTSNTKTPPKEGTHFEEAFLGWRHKEKRSRCMKISIVQDKNVNCFAAKRFENQRESVAELPLNKKPVATKVLNSRNSANLRSSKCRGPTGITVQQEECGLTERDSLKELQRIRHLYGGISDKTADGLMSDSYSHPKRRKMTSSGDDVCKIGVKNSSFKVKTDTSRREENIILDVADRTLSKSNPWIYPKGKRSCTCTLQHSIKSKNQSSPCAEVENNVEKYHILNDVKQKRVLSLLVYKRRPKVSSESECLRSSLKLAADPSLSINHNAASDKQVQNAIEFDTATPSKCGKSEDENLSSVDASGNKKSDILLSNGHSSTSQVFENNEKIKQPLNHLPRSPLMKELTRLGYNESLPDFLPKDSRRRRTIEKVCILFSQNLEANILKQQRKIVARLGFSITFSCSEATHFVTDRFVRTRNMLEAIALGKHVVTHFWLKSCEQAGYVIDEKSYILRDEKKEKEIGFNMPASLSRASQRPLLKGHRVLITSNVKPGVDAISSFVKAVGGQVVPSIQNAKTKDKVIPDDLLIISCEEDYTICSPFLEKGALIYNSELLLNGIVTQKLEYDRYQLFKDLA